MVLSFLLLAFLADAAGTVAGFGSSTLLMPFALLFFDFPTALVLVGFAHLFGNLGRVSFFRRGLDMRLLVAFGIVSVAASFAGAALVPRIPQPLLKGVLGAFLIGFAALSWKGERQRLPATDATAVAGGALSGFFAGLIGTGGALRGAFLTAYRLPKETYIATAAAIAIATDLTRIPVYLASGTFAGGHWPIVAALLPISILGTWVGKRLVDRIPQAAFRKIVLVALALIGAKFILDGMMSS